MNCSPMAYLLDLSYASARSRLVPRRWSLVGRNWAARTVAAALGRDMVENLLELACHRNRRLHLPTAATIHFAAAHFLKS